METKRRKAEAVCFLHYILYLNIHGLKRLDSREKEGLKKRRRRKREAAAAAARQAEEEEVEKNLESQNEIGSMDTDIGKQDDGVAE